MQSKGSWSTCAESLRLMRIVTRRRRRIGCGGVKLVSLWPSSFNFLHIRVLIFISFFVNCFLCHSTGFSNDGMSVCALSKQTNKQTNVHSESTVPSLSNLRLKAIESGIQWLNHSVATSAINGYLYLPMKKTSITCRRSAWQSDTLQKRREDSEQLPCVSVLSTNLTSIEYGAELIAS